MEVRKEIAEVTRRLVERSRSSREAYLERIDARAMAGPRRGVLSCGNLAHGFAACGPRDKQALKGVTLPNIGIVTAYNDMLSSHQPYQFFPDIIKEAAREAGGVAQVAGGVPAMCDGVTQGQPGMELSLLSRDVIAMGAAVALSHNMYDAAVFLGICDKIVPGLVMAALTFGHLPAVFIPGGPMPSGLPNKEKVRIRQLYAEGKIGRAELLEAEAKSYHAPGTCTFYGTANSSQVMMEIMGLQLPGSSFVNPYTPLRDSLTREATKRALAITALGNEFTPAGRVVDEKSIVNAVVGLHATGGSTNHTIHLIAMGKCAGIELRWEDIADLSQAVPLLARIYPNGSADVNHFHAAGGTGFLIGELLDGGWLHEDVRTIVGDGLDRYRREPKLGPSGEIVWTSAPEQSGNESVLTSAAKPFAPTGGLRMLNGNLGQAVIKISAVAQDRHFIEAPALVFTSQEEISEAFRQGKLHRDFVAVLRFQGPKANGMPELHKMVQPLGVVQDKGYRVALVTDGRMSGASGKVPAAIHVTPEAVDGGVIAKVRDGDPIRLDAGAGTLDVLVPEEELAARECDSPDLSANDFGMGRELFVRMRGLMTDPAAGASVLV